jgi:hypothetical protein
MIEALHCLRNFLKVGGTITVCRRRPWIGIFYPDNVAAHHSIQCQVELQKRAGGNAHTGRELYPLLNAAGFNFIG